VEVEEHRVDLAARREGSRIGGIRHAVHHT
jgi:hypothetical protein